MAHSLYGPVDGGDNSPDKEQIAVPDLKTAIRLATERAFEKISADLEEGCFNPASCIVIQDENGKTVHIVRFEELIDRGGRRSS